MSIQRPLGLRLSAGTVLLLAAVLGGCARREAAEAAPPPPAPPADPSPTRGADNSPPPRPAAPLDGARYALLVGVKTYIPTELKSLRYTENDVTDLADALKGGGYRPENVRLLTKAAADADPSAMPTGQNVRDELTRLVRDCKAGDSVLVALAGHGVQYKNSDDSYFCPADAKLADKKTLLSLSEICGQLDKCKAGFKLLLVDACRNDPFVDAGRDVAKLDLDSVSRPPEKLQAGGTVVLLSCSAGEKAFEDEDLKHGVFFNFVIEGLRGDADLDQDGVVVLPELELFAKKQVKRFVEAKYKSSQMPDLVSRSSRDLVPLVQVKDARVSLSSFVEDATTITGTGTGPADNVFSLSADGKAVVFKMYKDLADPASAPLMLWNPGGGAPPAALPGLNGMYSAVSADGKLLATFTAGGLAVGTEVNAGKIVVYDLVNHKTVLSAPRPDFARPVAFAPDGSLLLEGNAATLDTHLERVDAKTGRPLPVYSQGPLQLSGVKALSRDGAAVARVNEKRTLEVWDLQAAKVLCQSAWPADNDGLPTPTIWTIRSDGKTMVGCCQPFPGKPYLSVWDAAAGRQLCTIALPGGVYDDNLAFCPDGKTLIVATQEQVGAVFKPWFKFFDLASGKERHTSVQFPPARMVLLSADGTKLLTFDQAPTQEWAIKVGDVPLAVRKKPKAGEEH